MLAEKTITFTYVVNELNLILTIAHLIPDIQRP
jgi:hypothetical protein